MKTKRFLIFDLDDTLLDFKKGEHEGLTKIFRNHSPSHLAFDHWLTTFKQVNSEIWRQIESGGSAKALLDTRFSMTYQQFDVQTDGKQLEQEYRRYLDDNYYMIGGARELLEHLKEEGFSIIAGTNGKASTQRNRLKGTGLESLFDDVVISDEIGYAKPSKLFFDTLFKRNKEITAENALMIGDSLRSDIQGAANAGITSLWFNPHKLDNNTQIKPDFEAYTLKEISSLILSGELD
ncbi:MAG: YjjG family noncanonical pyrimidine nucleotidase [Alkalibacterium sp.]|nr:YjjG family noncanonical pyrimidine nucleotidase [Alkalibacterium sp.]